MKTEFVVLVIVAVIAIAMLMQGSQDFVGEAFKGGKQPKMEDQRLRVFLESLGEFTEGHLDELGER